ncbi:hypothetical protein GOBAR_AA31677 [Gossypium barbadense]|uniref:Uncharacterized protein n=1 Tax=Gossypium barbadense TaxID=3634 RepID=A0A2P5WD51_GOSBA|nr:hypothetical protein GOBAR_AA31677 [Gossypium barbadense]
MVLKLWDLVHFQGVHRRIKLGPTFIARSNIDKETQTIPHLELGTSSSCRLSNTGTETGNWTVLFFCFSHVIRKTTKDKVNEKQALWIALVAFHSRIQSINGTPAATSRIPFFTDTGNSLQAIETFQEK